MTAAGQYDLDMAVRPGTVITPEAVRLEFSLGGIATRCLAKIIDVLIAGTFTLLVGILGVLLTSALNGHMSAEGRSVLLHILLALDVFVGSIMVMPVMEWLGRGRTLGKAAMGLRVVTDVGEGISLRHAVVRGILQVVELPTGLAFFAAVSNPRQQRLGDLAAGTIVISDAAEFGHATMVPTIFPSPRGFEQFTAQLDVTNMTSDQFRLLRDFLLRCHQLTPDARGTLASDMATRITRIVGSPASFPHPELYLNCLASAYQQRYCPHLFAPRRQFQRS